uniref:Uncharacterized protein n=1 Tax=Anguilla anguilla TaxID=7936 RepID=A0A0E9PI96_ANGAN
MWEEGGSLVHLVLECFQHMLPKHTLKKQKKKTVKAKTVNSR